jgi:hypothetical protein
VQRYRDANDGIASHDASQAFFDRWLIVSLRRAGEHSRRRTMAGHVWTCTSLSGFQHVIQMIPNRTAILPRLSPGLSEAVYLRPLRSP